MNSSIKSFLKAYVRKRRACNLHVGDIFISDEDKIFVILSCVLSENWALILCIPVIKLITNLRYAI